MSRIEESPLTNTQGMDPLEFFTNEELLMCFHCKKTEISCIEQPHTFLNQLRDHNLVPEMQYKKVMKTKAKPAREKGVYQILDCLESERPESIKLFWRCMFQDHVLQQYPALRLVQRCLMDRSFEKLPEAEKSEERRQKESEKKQQEKGKSVEEEWPGPSQSTASTPRAQRRRSEKPIYSSPLRKGQREDLWNWPLYKNQLPIVCGNKKGSLYREKLARGERCILAEEHWFYPGEFEAFAGRKNSKNWKKSICCRNTTLLWLIEEGHLKAPPFKHRQVPRSLVEQGRRSVSSQSKNSASAADRNTVEEDRKPQHEEEDEEEDADSNESRREGVYHGDADLSVFNGSCLAVTCGSATGTLHKDRFASGTRGKCIRTGRWLTPVDFAREDSSIPENSWKKNILCQGSPLGFLIQEKVLVLHSLLCACPLCSAIEEDLLEQENDDNCFICSRQGKLLCCDHCPRAFHYACHLPVVEEKILGEQWMCTYCVLKESQQWRYASQISNQQAQDSCISGYMLQCQYLLLCLYKADQNWIFAPHPCTTVAGYTNVIQKPMWIDMVTQKLQEKQYATVGQFFNDVQLIFQNCAIFNKTNDCVAQIGIQLKKLFEEEFQKVFSIQQ